MRREVGGRGERVEEEGTEGEKQLTIEKNIILPKGKL